MAGFSPMSLSFALPPALESLLGVAVTVWGVPVTWAELTGIVLAMAMVVCNMRVHPAAWPLAIGSSLIYCLLFAHSKLYGEAALQIFFVLVAVWGWWQWLRGTDARGQALVVRSLPAHIRWLAALGVAAAWPALGLALDHWTDTDVPYWDAFPTTASLLGQYLLGRKYVENWPVWLVVNLVSMALYAYKGLWLTLILYAWFAGMSVLGWRAWLRLASSRTA